MQSIIPRMYGALQLGFQAAWRAFTDPQSIQNNYTRQQRALYYAQAWAYYTAKMYSRRDGDSWDIYLAQRQLYNYTRLIYNPVTPVVDFYVDNVWQMSRNGDYPKLVTDVADSATPEVFAAVAQLDQWSNWMSASNIVKRYTAATGNVLIEIMDDVVREVVTQKTVWAGHVTHLELSDAGDVEAYTLEYSFYDAREQQTYYYKKIVTQESFSYFRNDEPFIPPGKVAPVEENPYGFCPAVWIKHRDDGADFGISAITNLDKVDELNALASHLHDYIHKGIESPKLISTDGEVLPISGAVRDPVDGSLSVGDTRLTWVVQKTKQGASVHDLLGTLNLTEAQKYLQDLRESFTEDYPEIHAPTIIRNNAKLSGAALERLLTPAQNRLDAAAPNYNQQLIKLRQMQAAIAGWRLQSGNGWTRRDEQQTAFAPFNLDSYKAGNLDFRINRTLLIEESAAEIADTLSKNLDNANKATGLVPLDERMKIAGYEDENVRRDLIKQMRAEEPVFQANQFMQDNSNLNNNFNNGNNNSNGANNGDNNNSGNAANNAAARQQN